MQTVALVGKVVVETTFVDRLKKNGRMSSLKAPFITKKNSNTKRRVKEKSRIRAGMRRPVLQETPM